MKLVANEYLTTHDPTFMRMPYMRYDSKNHAIEDIYDYLQTAVPVVSSLHDRYGRDLSAHTFIKIIQRFYEDFV